MRIDSFSSAYPLDRPARLSTVGTSYREVKPVEDVQSGAPADDSPSSATASYREVEAPSDRDATYAEYLPARYADVAERYQQPVSAKAAQALASYGSTANMVRNLDANEVVGLDLYA
jgi:hypothetical protein